MEVHCGPVEFHRVLWALLFVMLMCNFRDPADLKLEFVPSSSFESWFGSSGRDGPQARAQLNSDRHSCRATWRGASSNPYTQKVDGMLVNPFEAP